MNRTLRFTDGHGFEVLAVKGDPLRRVHKLEGWWGAEPDTKWVERLGDGDFPGLMRRQSRKVAVGITEYLPDEAALVARKRQIGGLFRSKEQGDGELQVIYEGAEDLTAFEVALDGTPRVAADHGALRLVWELELRCVDPYLYGPLQSTQSQAAWQGAGLLWPLLQPGYLDWGVAGEAIPGSVSNPGNAVAYPLVVVQGSFPSGFRLDLAGDVPPDTGVEFAATVTDGQAVWIDFQTGRVLTGGGDSSTALTRRVWGGVAPGGQVTAQLTGLQGGSGWAQIELRPTYI